MSSPNHPRLEPHPPIAAEAPLAGIPGADSSPNPYSSDAMATDPNLSTHFPSGLEAYAAAPVVSPPVEDPVFNGWDVLLIASLTFVTMIVLQLGVTFGAHALWYRHESLTDVAQKPILLMVSQFLLYIAVAACMVAVVEGKYHVAFWPAIRWNWPRSQWKMLALGALVLLSLNFLGQIGRASCRERV